MVFVPSYKLGGTIEDAGADDIVCASVPYFVLENGVLELTERDLTEMLRFINVAYLITTKALYMRKLM